MMKPFLYLPVVFVLAFSTLIATAEKGDFIYTKENPQLEIQYFRTYDFEPKGEGAETKNASQFPQSTTTYIYAMLDAKNLLYQVRDQEYKLTFKYYKGDNYLMGAFDTNFLVEKGWEYTYYYDSWGSDTPGEWEIGDYHVELWIGSTQIGDAKFSITAD
ncbi:MAG: hypothetical protein H7A37_02520 [Chlamydiales bacterium]|nr:hypothetical protein [Chlamydiia bacterium]MCP5507163.1 hypothetical protein [Chlamydiales bacterium]